MSVVAFIGLGNMGAPMALNLAEAGHTVRGFDIAEHSRAGFAEAGGVAASSLADAVPGADVVITMLPAGEHVRDVIAGEGGVLDVASAGALLIDCSTIDVASARAVAEKAAASGRAMCDAPVSGGTAGAAAGTLTFMVGGTDDAFSAARPILEAMGRTIVHAGTAGAGQAAKICNNMVLGISMIAVCEAFNLADALGLDRQKLFDISSTASGQCFALTTHCPVPGPVPASPANRDYVPGFAAAMMLKDLILAQEAAGQADVETPLGRAASVLYDEFCASGGRETDYAGIIEFLRNRVGADPHR